MAVTQAQRAALYTDLVELMGQEAADNLVDQLPPAGWDQMATKDDLAAAELRLQSCLTEATAGTDVKFTESYAALQVAMQAGFTELRTAIATGLAEAAKERAEIVRGQAKQLYVIVSTIAVATISIWIALFTGAGSS